MQSDDISDEPTTALLASQQSRQDKNLQLFNNLYQNMNHRVDSANASTEELTKTGIKVHVRKEDDSKANLEKNDSSVPMQWAGSLNPNYGFSTNPATSKNSKT